VGKQQLQTHTKFIHWLRVLVIKGMDYEITQLPIAASKFGKSTNM
jgi:hypothetical protein